MDEPSMEEIFAEAVDKLLHGDRLEKIIRGYPTEKQSELSALLEIVELADQLKTMQVPQPSMARREHARTAFLQLAASRRTDLEEAVLPPALTPALVATANGEQAPAAPAKASVTTAKPTTGIRALIDRGMARLDEALRTPSLRLAPLAILLLVVSVMGLWVTAAAQDAGPGDPLHGLREWSLEQQLSLAPESVRAGVIRKMEAAARQDLAEVTTSDRNDLVSEFTTRQIHYGTEGNLLQVGLLLRPARLSGRRQRR
ncbi:MAG: hypothetical protein IPK16_03625 [Anaerolineales bacterium]|nr:hypothetical protein [Anaerolineales bacterium]